MSTWELEQSKFLNQEVKVTDSRGQIHIGVCKAINKQHFSIIIMTDTEKVAIRNVVYMTRKRTFTKGGNNYGKERTKEV